MAALLLVAVSVGLSNLAASIGIGIGGADARTRWRVAVVFGLLEAAMPIVGLLIGHGLATSIGHQARWLAAVLLIAVGGYIILTALRASRRAARAVQAAGPAGSGAADQPAPETERNPASLGRLVVSGLALSLDNLVAGFALGTYQVSLVAGAIVFGVVSTAMSLFGLELGARLGAHAGDRSELAGGVVLVAVGIAIGAGALG
jgi:manganese efflux pump family protein